MTTVEGASLTHLDAAGRATMVDVSAKAPTDRWARARAVVRMSPEAAAKVAAGDAPKGDVAAVARIAGIQAAKRTDELIPLAHQPPQLPAHERLAAGQAHVVHAHRAEQAHQALDLLVAEQRIAVEPRQAVGGHAVLAPEIATVRDRDANVPDRAAVSVDERLHERWKSALPPVLSSSSTHSITTPGSMPLTMS